MSHRRHQKSSKTGLAGIALTWIVVAAATVSTVGAIGLVAWLHGRSPGDRSIDPAVPLSAAAPPRAGSYPGVFTPGSPQSYVGILAFTASRYSWANGHTSPAAFRAAWRHIVSVFRQQGAGTVTWLWTVNVMDPKRGIPSPARTPWWPGSSYVTWVGIDGYYLKPTWKFASLFGPTIKAVRALTLAPILVSETGAGPMAGQPAKIADLFAGTHAYGLLGFVWFDAKRRQDWRITSPAAGTAFSEGAKTYTRSSP